MNNPTTGTFLAYVNNVADRTLKPLTAEMLDRLMDAPTTQQHLTRYRRQGDEAAKRQLPAALFNGLYSPTLADAHMADPTIAGRSHRDNECFVTWGFMGLDIDPKDKHAATPREVFETVWQKAREAFGTEPKQLIAMAYATATHPGLRIIVRRTKGRTIEEEQERWNSILPTPCDAKCKNLARLYFLPSRQDLLYLNKDLLFSHEPFDSADYPVPGTANSTPKVLQHDYTVLASAPTPPTATYNEETLEQIVDELEQCVGGGAAREGDRNNQVYLLAKHMRHLTGPNIAMLQNLIPRYNLSPDEHLRAITNALKAAPTANLPESLERAILRATSGEATAKKSAITSATPPPMPAVLPKAIEVLVSVVPEKTRAAAAISSFAAWRALMRGVQFHYIDNLTYEPSFFCICCANQTEGKTATRIPSDCILESVIEADRANRESEDQWREACSKLSANKDKPNAPQVPIRVVEPDMTNPAFVRRAVNAQGYSLYTYSEELEKLNRLNGLSEIIRTAYDGGRYGQERVAACSVSQIVEHLRWSFNVATTPQTARQKFKNELLNGTLTRLSFSTIASDADDFGDEMPKYGDFGANYKAQLKPFVEQLTRATGLITCDEALAWAERERLRQIDELRKKDMRYMVPFMKRSLQMGFWRAMMLYMMNGGVWTKDIEDFASWSIDYDLWCKLIYFGDLIEASTSTTPDNQRYTQRLTSLLPDEFTREQARNMRRDAGRSTTARDLSNMLNQWLYRGHIKYDAVRKVYIKTELGKEKLSV
ncbi:MAG: hypothetical protein J6R79_06705 [Bacteroidaceae bacterium]|nr:hypothetical protein [Bacteroidaceae bacterium]